MGTAHLHAKHGTVLACLLALTLLSSAGNAVGILYSSQMFVATSLSQPQYGLCAKITYLNKANVTLTGVIWGSFYNAIGQTAEIETATLTLEPGQSGTAYLPCSLANGGYTLIVFAVTPGGASISVPSTLKISFPPAP